MVALVFVTMLSISAALPAQPGGSTSSRPAPLRLEHHDVRSNAYAARARRRFAAYLRLRLLEMREAGLERAAAVVERRFPVDSLVPKRREP